MTPASLLNELWQTSLTRLGGTATIEASARETRAFLRPRAVKSAADLLRLILAYCLGGLGLRSTSAWAASAGLADLSNVALLQRLRNCGAWMEHLVGKLLVAGIKPAPNGRRIRLLDGTTVPKAGKEAKKNNGLWRLHCAFDLPAERFSFIELTDEKGGERLDRTPAAEGDILIADRGFLHPDPLAQVLEQGADVIVRAGSAMTVSPSIYWPFSRRRRAPAFLTDPFGLRAKRPHRWPSGSLPSASRQRQPKRREQRHGRLQSGKAMPSPPAR